MKKCKECGKDIDFLMFAVKTEEIGKLYAEEFIVENSERLCEDGDSFTCPECNAELFTNQDKAQEWLASE